MSLTASIADASAAAVETSAPAAWGPAPAWRIGLACSLVLHGLGAFAILFSLVRLTPTPPPADAVMAVEIAPAPSAPPAPPRQTPPGPERIQAVARPRPVDEPKIPPPPVVDTAVKPEVVLPPKQPDRPVLKQAAEQTTAPEAPAAPPKAQLAAPAPGASAAASNAPQSWESQLLAKLERNKRYPGAAQSQGQEDVVYIGIDLDRSGRVTNAKVVRSRGFPLLDDEVISLVRRSSPLPAPPKEIEGDPVQIVVPVEFFITRRNGRG